MTPLSIPNSPAPPTPLCHFTSLKEVIVEKPGTKKQNSYNLENAIIAYTLWSTLQPGKCYGNLNSPQATLQGVKVPGF